MQALVSVSTAVSPVSSPAVVVRQLLHGHYGTTSVFYSLEVEHGACLTGIVVLCFHGDLRKECQCSFRTDHKVSYDIERIVKADERKEVQSCYVLDGIFVMNTLG